MVVRAIKKARTITREYISSGAVIESKEYLAVVEPGDRDKSYLYDRVSKFMAEIQGNAPGSPTHPGVHPVKETPVRASESHPKRAGSAKRDLPTGRSQRAASAAGMLIAKVKENLRGAPNDPARFDATRFRTGVPPPAERRGFGVLGDRYGTSSLSLFVSYYTACHCL